MRINLVGPTYDTISQNLDASRSVNFYVLKNPNDAKSPNALIGTPGKSLAFTAGAGPIRGMHVFNGQLLVVSGGSVYTINTAGTVTPVANGTLSTSTSRVSIQDNGLAPTGGNQTMIVDGTGGYIYNANGTFSAISGGGWPANGADTCCFIDGYFMMNVGGGSGQFQQSALYDGTTWASANKSTADNFPDLLLSVFNNHGQLWLFGEYTTEIWYDAGYGTPTFQRLPGAVLEYGAAARWSIAKGNNSIFWLATQKNGDQGEVVGVVEANGYSPVVISPDAINTKISQASVISDAFGYYYTENGHGFYALTFPTANFTIVFDTVTKMWHERSSYNGAPYTIGRDLGNCYAYFNGMHLVGDYQSGNIYEVSSSFYSENGNPIVSMRTAQHMADKDNLNSFFIHRLQIDGETGVGDNTIVNPQASLSWSDDGGHTWSSEYQTSIGAIGGYKTRMIWRRLGYSRDRVFKLTISDSVKKVILGATVEAEKGSA